jgi:hypothetical protein
MPPQQTLPYELPELVRQLQACPDAEDREQLAKHNFALCKGDVTDPQLMKEVNALLTPTPALWPVLHDLVLAYARACLRAGEDDFAEQWIALMPRRLGSWAAVPVMGEVTSTAFATGGAAEAAEAVFIDCVLFGEYEAAEHVLQLLACSETRYLGSALVQKAAVLFGRYVTPMTLWFLDAVRQIDRHYPFQADYHHRYWDAKLQVLLQEETRATLIVVALIHQNSAAAQAAMAKQQARARLQHSLLAYIVQFPIEQAKHLNVRVVCFTEAWSKFYALLGDVADRFFEDTMSEEWVSLAYRREGVAVVVKQTTAVDDYEALTLTLVAGCQRDVTPLLPVLQRLMTERYTAFATGHGPIGDIPAWTALKTGASERARRKAERRARREGDRGLGSAYVKARSSKLGARR